MTRVRVGVDGGLRILRLTAAALAVTGCASGQGVFIAGAAAAGERAQEDPASEDGAMGPGASTVLASSGNVLLPFPADVGGRPVASVPGPGLGGAVAGLTGRAPAGGGLGAAAGPGSAAVGVAAGSTLGSTLTARADLPAGRAGVGAAATTPLGPVGVTAQLGAAQAAVGLTAPAVSAAGAPLVTLAGGALGRGGAPGVIAGPRVSGAANPNAIVGTVVTNAAGAVMRMQPPAGGQTPAPAMSAGVPGSQTLRAVVGRLTPPGG
ncbi:MAG: hypothetical protein JNK30_01850 [Phenylobacterium sp.]|uniref:hypothetical protein n=1 Tax=Phenylobacterium sp. TaxID=1871053 RepID=UPI001A3CFE75|nr:hypothetical protein [Phenylobacterium sp.]MBL8770098.1 hypothetical protein [Phenylobacterium sp.]